MNPVDGCLYFATRIDPLFLALPFLKNTSTKVKLMSACMSFSEIHLTAWFIHERIGIFCQQKSIFPLSSTMILFIKHNYKVSASVLKENQGIQSMIKNRKMKFYHRSRPFAHGQISSGTVTRKTFRQFPSGLNDNRALTFSVLSIGFIFCFDQYFR